MKTRIFVIALGFLCVSWANNIDMRYYELTYSHSGSFSDSTFNGTITCRPMFDTMINNVKVTKYRYIKQEANSTDTSFDYLAITDTSVINYAWIGNTPYVLLKRADFYDSLRLEDSPYSTLIFPFSLNSTWLTRPESTGLYSVKKYVGQENIAVPAGAFYCNKIYIQLLPVFEIADFYCDQWTLGNSVIKTYLHYGESSSTDELGNPASTTSNDWEQFELQSYQLIDTRSHDRGSSKISLEKQHTAIPYQFSIQGRIFSISAKRYAARAVIDKSKVHLQVK